MIRTNRPSVCNCHCFIAAALGMILIMCNIEASAERGVCYSKYLHRGSYKTYSTEYYNHHYKTCTNYIFFTKCNDHYSQRSKSVALYHAKRYATSAECCPGWKGDPRPIYGGCNPKCWPPCVHGSCTSPDHCTCESGWTGKTCRDDTNLLKWCDSIKNHNINNGYQENIQTVDNFINCGSLVDGSSTEYNKANAGYATTRLKADSDRCTTSSYKPALYELWKQHAYIRGHCCHFSNKKYYINLLNSLMKYEANFYQLVGCLTSIVAVELRKELEKLCSSSLSDQFCPIKAALDIIDLSAELPASKSQWTSHTEDHKTALLVHFAVLKTNYPTEFKTLSVKEKQIITNATNTILKLIRAKNVENLEKFQEFLPKNGALKNLGKCQVNHLCLLMKVIEQVRLFIDEANQDSNPPITNGRKRFVLNTAVDYREFLKQKQLDRIITVLTELKSTSLQIASDLKKHATTQFSELKSYFETIETFNQEIAKADIDYIEGRIESYKKSVNTITSAMQKDMTFLLLKTAGGVLVNIAEKVILLAMEIASAFNPLKWLTDGTSPKDILLATADLANAIADSVKLVSVSKAFINLRNKIYTFAKNIEKNDKFLNDVKTLIYKKTVTRKQFVKSRKNFLQEYNKYSPAIFKPDIDEIGGLWEVLVDAACDIVDGFDTTLGATFKSWIYDKGYCQSLPKDIAKLVSTYEEIYDYQFDLMDAMASYVRSSVALDAAKEINTEFTEITKIDVNQDSTLDTLQIMGVLTYVAYRVHLIETVHLYCNVLEYMERGVRPTECKGANTNIALLLASTPLICRSSTLRFYHVPTTGTNQSFVDLDDLFAGNQVSFKVPSADWLVKNDWIHPSEKDYTFYVKRFEVYLPVKPAVPTQFISTAFPVDHNAITPAADSTEYILIPNPHMVYEYMTGPSRFYCHNQPIKNPYTACETTDVSEVCMQSLDIKQRMYPSLYSQWTITVKGGEKIPVPQSATTDMSVIFGLQLCKVAPPEEEGQEAVADEMPVRTVVQENNQCCESGKYRPKLDSADCMSCPNGTVSALAGYYCEDPSKKQLKKAYDDDEIKNSSHTLMLKLAKHLLELEQEKFLKFINDGNDNLGNNNYGNNNYGNNNYGNNNYGNNNYDNNNYDNNNYGNNNYGNNNYGNNNYGNNNYGNNNYGNNNYGNNDYGNNNYVSNNKNPNDDIENKIKEIENKIKEIENLSDEELSKVIEDYYNDDGNSYYGNNKAKKFKNQLDDFFAGYDDDADTT